MGLPPDLQDVFPLLQSQEQIQKNLEENMRIRSLRITNGKATFKVNSHNCYISPLDTTFEFKYLYKIFRKHLPRYRGFTVLSL